MVWRFPIPLPNRCTMVQFYKKIIVICLNILSPFVKDKIMFIRICIIEEEYVYHKAALTAI